MSRDMDDTPRPERTSAERLSRLERDVHHMTSSLDEIKESMKALVTRVEFRPIELAVYGLVGLMLAALVGALVSLVVRP